MRSLTFLERENVLFKDHLNFEKYLINVSKVVAFECIFHTIILYFIVLCITGQLNLYILTPPD